MSRWLLIAIVVAVAPIAMGQSATDPPNPSSATTTAESTKTPSSDASQQPNSLPKKVWTNDNIHDVAGPVSVVGPKNGARNRAGETRPADPATVARLKQNLEKLQGQLDDTNKQLEGFKRFLSGEPVSNVGVELSHGVSRAPVPQQIASLEAKKKKLQEDIDALLDEARKKGVEPGQLR